jgi:hypothetical protein
MCFQGRTLHLLRTAFAALLCVTLIACQMTNDSTTVQPRNQSLPLFKPHVAEFACEVEATKVPPIDAEADAWFVEARSLEAPDRLDDPDYKTIVHLTRKAAERRHWKAMLNLASLYLEQRDPQKGVEDAVRLVESAMELGIPAAYDRMGTYFMNGTGVKADSSKAYAFWQKAAEMGSPAAMTFLADKLRAGEDGAIPGYWANIPVATKMLACALAQGHGPAAYNLHYLYSVPRAADGRVTGDRNPETKARALKILHEGVRFGCADCANKLQIEFDHPFDLADMIAPFPDKARGERYGLLGDELAFNPDARFPNLDKVLPLPPANLPPWNGDRDTLLAAAMGVSLPLTPQKVIDASQGSARAALDPAFTLRNSGFTTSDVCAPMAGYWRRVEHSQSVNVGPGLYQKGEKFDTMRFPFDATSGTAEVVWEHWLTIRNNDGAVEPLAARGLTREVPPTDALMSGVRGQVCPASGTWQPWLPQAHPMQGAVNQYWRQVWLLKGQSFPSPERDWMLPLSEEDMAWYLIDGAAVNIG